MLGCCRGCLRKKNEKKEGGREGAERARGEAEEDEMEWWRTFRWGRQGHREDKAETEHMATSDQSSGDLRVGTFKWHPKTRITLTR